MACTMYRYLPENVVSWIALQPGSPSKNFWNMGDSSKYFFGKFEDCAVKLDGN